ncbi:hypothetical protein ACH3XW_45480 [Acanthocheilonema viteae]
MLTDSGFVGWGKWMRQRPVSPPAFHCHLDGPFSSRICSPSESVFPVRIYCEMALYSRHPIIDINPTTDSLILVSFALPPTDSCTHFFKEARVSPITN